MLGSAPLTPPPQFHICYRSVQSEVNVKTLQINPESDRSSISCQRYHFPSKRYGWQFDNCHPDLASLKHSPKTHRILQGRWDEITDIRNLPALSKNATICREVYTRRYAPSTKTLGTHVYGFQGGGGYILRQCWCPSHVSPCVRAAGDKSSRKCWVAY